MFMETITMVDLRQKSEQIVRQLKKGQSLNLSYRGKKIALILPIKTEPVSSDDPIFHLSDSSMTPMSNEDIDKAIYGDAR